MKTLREVPFTGDPEAWNTPVQRSLRLSAEDWWKADSIASVLERDRSFVVRRLIRYLYGQLFELSADGEETPIGELADQLEVLERHGLR